MSRGGAIVEEGVRSGGRKGCESRASSEVSGRSARSGESWEAAGQSELLRE